MFFVGRGGGGRFEPCLFFPLHFGKKYYFFVFICKFMYLSTPFNDKTGIIVNIKKAVIMVGTKALIVSLHSSIQPPPQYN